MTTAAPPYGRRAPHSRLGRGVKGAVALMLLMLLGFVSFVAYQYYQTGSPISEVAGVRNIKPVANLLKEPPKFSASVWNVARPLGVAVGPDGTIYVTESAGERLVKVFDANGVATGSFAIGGDTLSRNPTYIAVAPDGRVFVSDMATRSIAIFSATGEPLGQVASPFAEGWVPSAISFDTTGNMYVTDFTPGQHRVLVFDQEGTLTFQMGSEGQGTGQFSFPNGVAADTKGNIYVADSGNGRVQAFDSTGKLKFVIGRGTAAGDLAMPRGIAVDNERKQLLVVDTTDQQVKVYDLAEALPKLAYTLSNEATATEQLRFPNGLAIDGKGHIYVADRENARVAVWRY